MDKHVAREQEKKKDRTKISKQKTTPQSAKCIMRSLKKGEIR
jgi:hypothetical protein